MNTRFYTIETVSHLLFRVSCSTAFSMVVVCSMWIMLLTQSLESAPERTICTTAWHLPQSVEQRTLETAYSPAAFHSWSVTSAAVAAADAPAAAVAVT